MTTGNICDDCGLLIAHLSITHCFLSWVVDEGEPELAEEQVLDGERKPCSSCKKKLQGLGISFTDQGVASSGIQVSTG